MPECQSHLSRLLFTAWSVCLLGIALLPVQAAAQDTPYEAQIIENRVEIRSGAGRAYYEVGELQRGDRVTVEDELFNWYKIRAPKGVFCFVDRKNVDAKADGTRGVVNTDGTAINAAHASKGPADSYRNLLKLNAGDTVEIVETVNNAYKIIPPGDTYVYLPPGAVEPVQAEPEPQPLPTPPAPEPQPTPPAPTPTPPTETTPEPTPAPAQPEPAQPEPDVVAPPRPRPVQPPAPVQPQPTPPANDTRTEAPAASSNASADDLLNDPDVRVATPKVPVETPAQNEMLRAVEVAILPYFTLPVDRQPIAKMVRGYADASQIEGLSENDQAIIRTRLAELERNRELASAMAEIDSAATDTPAPTTAEAPAEPADQPDAETPVAAAPPAPSDDAGETSAPTPVAPPVSSGSTAQAPPSRPAPAAPAVPSPATEYDAVGILTASTVHTGSNQPELLRLLDPTGRRTVAYIEPGSDVDTIQLIGRLVGIIGESMYDPTTKLNLIQPSRIDLLSPR